MIIFWDKEEKKTLNKKNQIKPENEKTINTLIYPFPNELNNSNLFDLNELNDSSEYNYSFVEEDSISIIDICKEINNNNISETRAISINDSKNVMEKHIINSINSSFKKENSFNEKKIIDEINNFIDKQNFLINDEKIINLFNLCKGSELLHNLLFDKIISNLVFLFNNKRKIYETIYKNISKEEKEILINEIIKNTPQLIINKNGYLVLLFLLSFRKINIINNIIYFISYNFVNYCFNDYSSEIICSILSMGFYFSTNFLNNLIKTNFELISKNENGIKVIKKARK
jgi:hypothetical protein